MSFGLGGAGQQEVLDKLGELFEGADSVSIAVSYIQSSGWRLLSPMLKSIEKETRILCTDQLGITDPNAVRQIQTAGVGIHCYVASNVYHPKVFIAHREGAPDKFVLGSANLSQSALKASVEAVIAGEDDDGYLVAWFDAMFDDKKRSTSFDEKRLARLELWSAARLKSRLTFQRSASKKTKPNNVDVAATDTIEKAFATLPRRLVTLNADKAANNVRTFRQMKKVLDGTVALKGKAFSELKLIGMAANGGFTPLGKSIQNSSIEKIANKWMNWLKHASEQEINSISPSGQLAQTRTAFATFWRFPKKITAYFLENCESPSKEERPVLQTIELLANTGKSFPGLTVEDVKTLSTIVTETSQLETFQRAIIRDYLKNKGTRGWRLSDRKTILEAWKNA